MIADEKNPDGNEETEATSEEDTKDAPKPAEALPSKKKRLLKIFSFLSFIPKQHKQHKLLSLIVVGVLILTTMGGVAGYYFIFSKKHPEETESSTIEYSSVYFPLPDLKIAIRKENNTIGYLVIGITLKISAEIKIEDFRKREPEILDILHTYLTSVSFNNLDKSNEHCLTSSAGLERLRANIMRRINIALPPLKVDTVLLRKLICQ